MSPFLTHFSLRRQNNSMLWMNLNETWNLPASQMLMMSLCIGAVLPPFSWSGGRNWAGNWWLILTPSQLLTVSRSARCCGPLGTACMALPKMWLQIPTVQYSNRVTEWNIHNLTLYFHVFPMGKRMQKGGTRGMLVWSHLIAHFRSWFSGLKAECFGSARFFLYKLISSYCICVCTNRPKIM